METSDAKTAYADYRNKANKWEKDMAKKRTGKKKKVYISGYRIAKEKIQTNI